MKTKRPILIVDDDTSQRSLIEFWLQEDGFTTLTAKDGTEGFQLYEQHAPSLVITDMRMPGMSGLDMLSRIKVVNPDTPVIVITAFGTVDDAVQAMKLGAADYVSKPLNGEELKLNVRRALERQQLVDENRYLRDLTASTLGFENIIAQSRKMRNVLEVAAQVAPRDSTVLLTGESGTGKELLARAIHQNSLRAGKPFIPVNCAALPETLAESELFGHRKGSFTGATADRAGKFEAANEGTIFLDEIGDLPLSMQVKLLRVIQEREIDKIGDPRPVKVNVRILAATNRNLKNRIADGDFREDLYYRLSVVTIEIPPLREHREDILLLLQHFLDKFQKRHGVPHLAIAEDARHRLLQYNWPGNVRELENVIERLVVLARSESITEADLPAEVRASESRIAALNLQLPEEGISLENLEKEVLQRALEKHGWNQTHAARYLDITRSTLLYRMEKYGLRSPGDVAEPKTGTAPSR